jgi:phospholipid/cholesterol/gamma-HCH transport system substrate-binding protein
MRRTIGRWRVAANVGFALAVLALGGFGVYQVAGRHWRVQPTFRIRAEFDTIGGVEAGHRVRLQGIDAGVVERVVPPREPGGPVELVLRIDERLHPLVRSDTVARIVAEGLVGARTVELRPGRPDAPPVAELDRIASEPPVELSDLMKKAADSLARLNALAGSAEERLSEIRAIAGPIRNGQGSLGKLVHDDTLYHDLAAVARRGEHALSALEDNLDALKQTWPLSRYFNRRAYFDRDRVLFQPGAQRNSRALRAEDLFEPGRSVLTPVGRARLDEIARWFKAASHRRSELVIAAFTDDERDRDLAEILTQDQADAVRNYLVEKHSVQSAGWFKRRKIASVGFGSHKPKTVDAEYLAQPPRRVEIILFTPQT